VEVFALFRSQHLRSRAGECLKLLALAMQAQKDRSVNRVTFLSGVPRSGTNMVMDLLEYSPDTKVFHDRDPRAYRTFMLRDDEIIKKLAKSALPVVVFKALCEAERLNALMSHFSHASIIWVFRNYEAVNASNMVRWPGSKNGLDAIVKDRNAAGWRGLGMTDETWRLIKKYYRKDMSVASAQALFWYYRNQLFFDQHLDRDPRTLLIRYETIARNPEGEINRIAEFLGIRMPQKAIAHVSPSSAGRKVQLDIDPSIRVLCGEMFERLNEALARQNEIRPATPSLERPPRNLALNARSA
jgi:hypothetical protein